MNRLKTFFIIGALLIAMGARAAFAFTSVSISTVTAWISFGSELAIDHVGIEHISPYAGVAIATGTVSSRVPLVSLAIYHSLDTDEDFTLSTFTVSGRYVYEFRLEMPITNSEAKYLYYYIMAVNELGIEAYWPAKGQMQTAAIDAGTVSNVSQNGGSVVLADSDMSDGETTLLIPPGALSTTVPIQITELDPSVSLIPRGENGMAPIVVYQFEPEGLVFAIPATLSLRYRDRNHDGIVDNTAYRADDLKVVWWDGFTWRLVGGMVDRSLNLVTAKIMHFSLYGLMAMPSLADDDYRPKERIITPALQDGINDFASFGGLSDGDTVTIFDITGKKVRQLSNGDFIWNGRDDNNALVESGIYLYQIKTGGKIISGTIVVAK